MERTACLLAVAALAAATLVAGCGGDDNDTDTSCQTPVDSALQAAVGAHVGTLRVDAGSDEGDADRVDTDICRTSQDRATATVTVVGLRDDSVRDHRHELTLEHRADGEWRVTGDRHTYRCQAGRGQQSFAATLCV